MNETTNILDYTLTESQHRILALNHLPPPGNIDHGHHVLVFNYTYLNDIKKTKLKNSKILYHKGKYSDLNLFFTNIDWDLELYGPNIDKVYNKFLLGRFEYKYTPEEFEKYVRSIPILPLKIVKLETKQTRFSSFRLIFANTETNKDLAFNGSSRPYGALIRKYFYKQKPYNNREEEYGNEYEDENYRAEENEDWDNSIQALSHAKQNEKG